MTDQFDQIRVKARVSLELAGDLYLTGLSKFPEVDDGTFLPLFILRSSLFPSPQYYGTAFWTYPPGPLAHFPGFPLDSVVDISFYPLWWEIIDQKSEVQFQLNPISPIYDSRLCPESRLNDGCTAVTGEAEGSFRVSIGFPQFWVIAIN